jgi:hypothetical protein
MDEEVLQKTNVMKLLPRIMKKGGKTVKELAQAVLDNAAASTKRKQEVKASNKDELLNKDSTPETVDAFRPDLPAGTKRPRDGESNGLPAPKRPVAPSTNKGVTTSLKLGNGGITASKREPSSEAKTTPSATHSITARPKANIVAPKPTSLFGSLTSASKKPGTSNAARAAAAAAAAAKEKARYVHRVESADLVVNILTKVSTVRPRRRVTRLRSPPSLLGIFLQI